MNAAGVVTPVANGLALITATYQSVSGSMALAVVAPSVPPPGSPAETYTLSGVVRATPLNENVAVSGLGSGQKVVTDASGRYALSGLYGSLSFAHRKAGTRPPEATLANHFLASC